MNVYLVMCNFGQIKFIFMKILLIAMATFFAVGTISAQDGKGNTKAATKKESTVKLKDHVCTNACKDGCVYAHGEKGHKCTSACKAEKTDKGAGKGKS